MRMAALQDVAQLNPSTPRELSERPELPVSFVPMTDVGEDGRLHNGQERPVGELLKGYTYFSEGDVLVAKITPCMQNGKAAHVTRLKNKHAFGSTEFHVLRPGPTIDGRYLFYMVWNPAFRHFAEQRFTGSAGQKRVPATAVAQFKIPIPFPNDTKRSLKEQKRIAAILDKADAIRRKRQEACALGMAYGHSLFADMFGNPLNNDRGWETVTIDNLCRLVRGSSPRPKGDSRYYGGPIPRLMIEDITRDGRIVRPRVDSLTKDGAKLSRPVPADTVVMAVSGNVGLVSRLAVGACIHDGFVGFVDLNSKKAIPDYLVYCLDLLKQTHAGQMAGAIWQNLTTHQVKAMEIPTPPLHDQQRFTRLLDRFEETNEHLRTAARQTDDLFNSLVQRAFRGEL